MQALFCGDGTLLIQCAEAFRTAGGGIAGVLTSDPRITAWAGESGVPHLGTAADGRVPEVGFDYLFSVANLTVLPAPLVAAPRRMAINFHDGPLPGMAGLNAPAWAILMGHDSHAITWHQMTERVDAGGAIAVRRFPILPTDTAFSLNARCYEAGLESFVAMIPALLAGQVTAEPLSGTRGWFGRAKRPRALGTLDFGQPAAELCRTVRALDFGGYDNPLAAAKVWTGDGFLAVRRLEIGAPVTAVAGTVIACDESSVTVAAVDAAVRLSALTDLDGTAVDPLARGLGVGTRLPPAPPLPDETVARVGRAEGDWQAALSDAAPSLPHFPRNGRGARRVVTVPLDAGRHPAEVLGAAWIAWVAGINGQSRGSIAFGAGGPAAHPALSPLRLVTATLDAETTCAALTERIGAARRAAAERAPMAADLAMRIADADARATARQAFSVAVADSGLPEGASLALLPANGELAGDAAVWDEATVASMARAFGSYLAAFTADGDAKVAALPLTDQPHLGEIGAPVSGEGLIDRAIAAMAAAAPDAPALEAGAVTLTFAELDARAAALARALVARGAGRGSIVGVCIERSADLVIGLLAVLKAGAAYLPLDPDYPAERIALMVEDSGAALILASPTAADRAGLDAARIIRPDATAAGDLPADRGDDDLAYLIYTSGSTGRPKGVMIPHRTVANFMAGMDSRVPLTKGARFLSVTSVSFDISVLEIFWTLARGATLVLQVDAADSVALPDFSLFYFASEASGTGHHAYRLLLEGARFADENGFSAIWTPERHFHAFGGLYPNPAISSAALAGLTRNVKLRAGSSVVPLHHPVRVAEDWALVDNLSNGRAGIAIAAGWQPNDFILRPDAFATRKDQMLAAVETLRKLWKGEPMSFPGPDGKPVAVEIHPKPMQVDLPLWLTAAGNPETFVAAGRLGCGVLTHLLGQTFEEVAEKIAAYRHAWRMAGHPGDGHVVLMLHTFVGETEDEVRATARGPMKGYLKSAVDLVRRASWTFPTIVQRAEAGGVTPQEMFEKEALSDEDLDQLLEHAFERYYRTSGLFGTPETARDIVRDVARIGVDEIACLIDFGIDTDVALTNLPRIKALMDAMADEGQITRKATVAEEIVARGITHLQCTPSMAAMLAADAPGRAALSQLQVMLVGGEALAPDLAQSLRATVPGALFNMYGPTETTIWSTVARLDTVGDRIPLGEPIINTVVSVRSSEGRPLPDLAEGELWIGGAGVAKGYWNRPELTAERFVDADGMRFYRTGDLVRRVDGTLEFLGRIDNQVKIRGHRIELGEIEARLSARPEVARAVVQAVGAGTSDVRLVGYVTPARGTADPAALRQALAAELPEIMVPSRIVVLDRMPMTPNGKIDRKALPAATDQTAGEAAVAAPAATDLEAEIAGIWSRALGLQTIPVTGNFFDLGGHSLLVVQVQRQMKERLQREIAITDLFRFPTVRGIAAFLAPDPGQAGAEPPASAAGRGAARAEARLARLGRR